MNWFTRILGRDGVKDIEPWRSGAASTENGDNFTTNQVTLADWRDGRYGQGNAVVGLSATWACVQLIAGTIASLPLMIYRTENGIRRVAKDHPLYFVLHDSPNFDQTAVDFWEVIAASIELHGNAYASIERRQGGIITALYPIPPERMTVRRRSSGDLEYAWTENGRRYIKRSADVLHIRGPLGDGVSGSSTLSVCRSVFSDAMSAEEAAGAIFQNGVNPSGVLSTKPETQLSREQRVELERHLQEKYMGSIRQGRPMLLDNGLSWEQISIDPQDAQMLESRKFSGEQICRIFGVPPAMVGYGDKASNWGTGKEADVLGFQKFTLRKRLKRMEQSVLKQLVPLAERRQQGITIEFNFEGLLRGDTASRYEAYEKAIRMGLATRNECRALENLPPVEGGDVITVQMQDIPLVNAINGDRNGQENGSDT
ncbi:MULTISPECIES: phage portal protein [Agrobacterium]|uniref:phage portal protein n=1 Tax=Agrobacterium TaxID=357 RepID=UPI0027887779|nr:phage portal protein [Agrobacterium sp. SORGH_AS_0745]MDP9758312.1 HK97 family phage portal protein [Agrobacterium tumefaciens]MDQ1219551.1 HK97 family phage portal protein [Agrobacterium sp. SORGH_AS_0745]